jgi:hypothetical protein
MSVYGASVQEDNHWVKGHLRHVTADIMRLDVGECRAEMGGAGSAALMTLAFVSTLW